MNWTESWVEGDLLSGSIIDQLHPEAVDGADTVNASIADLVSTFDSYSWRSLYYMPRVVASAVLTDEYSGHVDDDVTMMLIRG